MKVGVAFALLLSSGEAFLFPKAPTPSLVKVYNQFGKIEPIPPGSVGVTGALDSNPDEPWFPDAISTVIPTKVDTAMYDKEGRLGGEADDSFGEYQIAIAEKANALEKAAKEEAKKAKAKEEKAAPAKKPAKKDDE
mgnify:FL=1